MSEETEQDGAAEVDKTPEELSEELSSQLESTRENLEEANVLMQEAESLRGEVVALRDKAKSQLNEISKMRNDITTQTSSIQEALPSANKIVASSQETSGAIKQIREQSQQQLQSVEAVVEKLNRVNEITQLYEDNIETKKTEYEQLVVEINKLLPGATSAGLATAFANQKSRFFWPKIVSVSGFIGCMILLFGIGFYGSGNLFNGEDAPTFTEIGAFFLPRIPLAVPVVWLALYAMRQRNLNERLEEDYAYKETVASAFQGFKQQMDEVDEKSIASASAILAENVIRTISLNPGRLFDVKTKDITPLNSAVDSLNPMLDKLITLKKSTSDAETTKVIDEMISIVKKILLPYVR